MKKLVRFIVSIILISGTIFVFGPIPDDSVDLSFDVADIGQDVESYLEKAESLVPNIVSGAEKEVVWSDPVAKSKKSLSIIYIHGFSATKHEMRPVPDDVANALNANLFFTRMSGHGRDGDAMAEATPSAWINDFAEAIAIGEQLGEKIIVMAASNGAAVSTLGLSYPELVRNVVGFVTISANFELHGISTTMANIPWAETILPVVAGSERSWEPSNELHGKWWTTAYPSKAIFPMTSILKRLKKLDKSTLSVPALFIYQPDDQVVVAEEIENVADQWGGPAKKVLIEQSEDPYNHVIAGDILSPVTIVL